MAIHSRITARTTRTAMATLNPITHRRSIRTGTPSHISQIGTRIHGPTRRTVTIMAIAPAIEEVELQLGGVKSGSQRRFYEKS